MSEPTVQAEQPAVGELLDSEALFRSINGFEQIAVEQHFRTKIEVIANDAFTLMRALLFVVEKRDGMADGDAFRNVMLLRLDDVTSRFEQPGDAAGEDDPSLREQQDREYAEFVVGVGLSFMPDQFRALTMGERAALVTAARARG